MQTFLIERDLTGISMADLHGMAAASLRHTACLRAEGDRIYYLGSTFLPYEGRCLCLFEAKDETVISALNAAAHLPCARFVPAMNLALPLMALG